MRINTPLLLSATVAATTLACVFAKSLDGYTSVAAESPGEEESDAGEDAWSQCDPGTIRCRSLTQTQVCESSGTWGTSTDCVNPTPQCQDGTCVVRAARSCDSLSQTCGSDGKRSCCANGYVQGGVFLRDNDYGLEATVSDFYLDIYEVTVGRFRKFVQAYPSSLPIAGSGGHRLNPSDIGWESGWNGQMPTDADALRQALACGAGATWLDEGNDSIPINCVTWFEAFAFCIWDGGRLPTETEWNFAAAGGDEQRVYPWSQPAADTTITPDRAVFNPAAQLGVPGSRSPAGDGKWNQADLAGNVAEWVRDWDGTMPTTCDNCAILSGGTARGLRGGSSSRPTPADPLG